MTIPKRFEEVLEGIKVSMDGGADAAPPAPAGAVIPAVPGANPADAAGEALANRTQEAIVKNTSKTFNSSTGESKVAAVEEDKISQLVNEFGLQAGGNKLTTWEQAVKRHNICCSY